MGVALARQASSHHRRRGTVAGMEPLTGGRQKVVAEVPEVEIVSYTIDLKAMTQGTGQYTREFVRWEDVPHALQAKLLVELNREED